jgi:hypothetical protein
MTGPARRSRIVGDPGALRQEDKVFFRLAGEALESLAASRNI